jgi:hypothetical protein
MPKKAACQQFPGKNSLTVNHARKPEKKGWRRTRQNRVINGSTPVALKFTNHQKQIEREILRVSQSPIN